MEDKRGESMKYCQGPICHEHKTKDRIRGPKGAKRYETRRRSSFYYGKGNFCDQRCMYDWIDKHIEHGLDHFGRITEPRVLTQDMRGNADMIGDHAKMVDINTMFIII